ncbi:hypothetical protein AXG93_3673s1030 [Marchantia polymorpha subsp. ruderalis]|uniref:Uncharacterized protein n=1 Tax=Marchantia polymorpha subsp. ruderalis TaxID=1480154 RepID=A0A176VGV8_MARPO|nr:hypothetical protein AXG93_3673s1030 [Marchantia polymorpha subsp. ruderalis]
MDHAKSNNTNSLVTGAGSALALYYIVHPQLVTNPSYASSVGLGLSAVLLGLKGIRYKVTRRMFPAGVVAVSSLETGIGGTPTIERLEREDILTLQELQQTVLANQLTSAHFNPIFVGVDVIVIL